MYRAALLLRKLLKQDALPNTSRYTDRYKVVIMKRQLSHCLVSVGFDLFANGV